MAEHAGTRDGKYVQANGIDIFYEEYGQGTPLLLLHGGVLTAASWGPYLAAFAEHYRVITPDTRGHGQTANPSAALSYRLLADDVAAFLLALGVYKPLIFGYSDGGQVALEIGMRYPDLPRALVIACAYTELTEDSRVMVRAILGDEQSPDVDTEKFARENPDFAAGLRRDHGPEAWKTLLKEVKPMWNAMLNYSPDDFARVVARTLVMVGDRDNLVPVEEGVRMYRLLPNAEFAVVPGAGHGHFAFSPEKIAIIQPLIMDFLRRHSEASPESAP